MTDETKKRLGRGLAALIGEIDKPAAANSTDQPLVAADRKVSID
ncbi:chromosome partitioning protein ParB, partial [Salmonella enterica subsp. enterica serovar Enteritidis]|nr:chromosome partitioning protein ParB [Salmonella enterica subsp. enterica serovar Enteritidis]